MTILIVLHNVAVFILNDLSMHIIVFLKTTGAASQFPYGFHIYMENYTLMLKHSTCVEITSI